MKRFVIDTDVGIDDAIALMMPLRLPAFQVEAIITVAGDGAVEQVTRKLFKRLLFDTLT